MTCTIDHGPTGLPEFLCRACHPELSRKSDSIGPAPNHAHKPEAKASLVSLAPQGEIMEGSPTQDA